MEEEDDDDNNDDDDDDEDDEKIEEIKEKVIDDKEVSNPEDIGEEFEDDLSGI